MPVSTIVDAYIHAAIKLACFERVDGVFAATIPDAFGIVALGATRQECKEDLHARLEEWVVASLSEGDSLPVIGGIDLTCTEVPTPAPDRAPVANSAHDTIYKNGPEFFAALTQWERER